MHQTQMQMQMKSGNANANADANAQMPKCKCKSKWKCKCLRSCKGSRHDRCANRNVNVRPMHLKTHPRILTRITVNFVSSCPCLPWQRGSLLGMTCHKHTRGVHVNANADANANANANAKANANANANALPKALKYARSCRQHSRLPVSRGLDTSPL